MKLPQKTELAHKILPSRAAPLPQSSVHLVQPMILNLQENHAPQIFAFNDNYHASIVLTPNKFTEDKLSVRSRTPISAVDKIIEISPFKTTCQKRPHNSPLSPSVWKKINSSLKKTKRSMLTPLGSIFQNSNIKDDIFDRNEGLMTPLLQPFKADLHFPDLQTNFGEPFSNEKFTHEPFFVSFGQLAADSLTYGDKEKITVTQLKNQIIVKEKGGEDGCNCRSTKCLKLYCECLRQGKMCNNCNCTGCENHAESRFRSERVLYIEKKNPNAFKPIIVENDANKVHNKGCNCRRSHCLKNYCECHQFGVKCTEACKCTECKNFVQAKKETHITRTRRHTDEEKGVVRQGRAATQQPHNSG